MLLTEVTSLPPRECCPLASIPATTVTEVATLSSSWRSNQSRIYPLVSSVIVFLRVAFFVFDALTVSFSVVSWPGRLIGPRKEDGNSNATNLILTCRQPFFGRGMAATQNWSLRHCVKHPKQRSVLPEWKQNSFPVDRLEQCWQRTCAFRASGELFFPPSEWVKATATK